MAESMVERVAKAIYGTRFPRADVADHFEWYKRGLPNPQSCVHYSNVALVMREACAAIEAMADDDAAKVFWKNWATKRLEISRVHWVRAAKAALDRGDMRGLRLRIDQIEAPPAQIVGSEAPTPTERESA